MSLVRALLVIQCCLLLSGFTPLLTSDILEEQFIAAEQQFSQGAYDAAYLSYTRILRSIKHHGYVLEINGRSGRYQNIKGQALKRLVDLYHQDPKTQGIKEGLAQEFFNHIFTIRDGDVTDSIIQRSLEHFPTKFGFQLAMYLADQLIKNFCYEEAVLLLQNAKLYSIDFLSQPLLACANYYLKLSRGYEMLGLSIPLQSLKADLLNIMQNMSAQPPSEERENITKSILSLMNSPLMRSSLLRRDNFIHTRSCSTPAMAPAQIFTQRLITAASLPLTLETPNEAKVFILGKDSKNNLSLFVFKKKIKTSLESEMTLWNEQEISKSGYPWISYGDHACPYELQFTEGGKIEFVSEPLTATFHLNGTMDSLMDHKIVQNDSALLGKIYPLAMTALQSQDIGLMSLGVSALGKMGCYLNAEVSRKGILELLGNIFRNEDTHRHLRNFVLTAMADMGPLAIPYLLELLPGYEEMTRRLIMQSIDRICQETEGVPAEIIKALKNQDSWTRIALFRVLGNTTGTFRVKGLQAEALPLFREHILSDPDREVRIEAIKALGGPTHREGISDILLPLIHSFDREIQLAVIDALGRSQALRAFPELVRLLDHPASAVRHAAVVALTRSPRAVRGNVAPNMLVTILQIDDMERSLKFLALDAMAKLAAPGSSVLEDLRVMLSDYRKRDDKEIVKCITEILERFNAVPEDFGLERYE